MFNLIFSLLRGRAYEVEQAFADRHAVPILAQQIRDAALAIQFARRAVAVAIAQNEQEKKQYAAIVDRITDLEARALAALQRDNAALAHEAAEAIAYLEAERDASQAAQAQFASAIGKLKRTVRAAEARLEELRRGERLARATEEAQKLDAAGVGQGLAVLADAEETLLRLRTRQTQNEATAAALIEMEGVSSLARITEKLADSGCGAPLRTSADDVLFRLRRRMNSAA
ncbi:MAG: PspA/IM30 family protein [Pararhizobium sp.]